MYIQKIQGNNFILSTSPTSPISALAMLPTPHVHADFEKVYEPSEDSFLLIDALEAEKDFLASLFSSAVPIVVEIGTGSGIVTTFLHKSVVSDGAFLTTDLNPHACEASLSTSQENGGGAAFLDSIQCDLTSPIRRNIIDLLVFNPPYVPAEDVPSVPKHRDDYEWLDLALLGGSDGMVVTYRLLENLDSILSKNGVAYILFCARNNPQNVAEEMGKKGWKSHLVINRKAGWEDLSVYRFSKA